VDQPPPLIRRGRVPAALSILAAVLGLVHLGTRSVWLDEAVTVNVARLEPAPFLRALAADAGNMSAYYAVMRAWVHLGEQEWVVRLPSVAFFSAAVGVLWLLADRLFGRAVATTAALLLAVSPSAVRYAQEARGYALELLLVVASWWALVHALRRRSAWAWAGYVAASTLAVYTHFFGALVVAAQAVAVWLSSESRSRRAPLVAMSAAAMSAVPLAVLVRRQGMAQIQWIPPVDGRQLAEAASLLAGAGTEYGWARLALVAVVSAAVALGAARAWTRMRQGPPRGTGSLCYAVALAWLVVPTVSALLVSVARPMLVPRYLIVALPAAALLAALGLQAALRPAARAAVLGAVVALSLHGVWSWYRAEFGVDSELRETTAYVLSGDRPGDGIVFLPQSDREPFEYYWRRAGRPADAPVPIAPPDPWGARQRFYTTVELDLALRTVARHRRVWLVTTRTDAPLPPGEVGRTGAITQRVKAITWTTDDALRRAGFVVVSHRLFTEREVRLYERRPAVRAAGTPMRPSSP
jgi:mannosyltransferase